MLKHEKNDNGSKSRTYLYHQDFPFNSTADYFYVNPFL
jgi:hypothetical protein